MLKIKQSDRLILLQVFNFSRGKKAQLFIVGGFLRDLFLKREKENPDIDFCIRKNAIGFGRALARELKAGFVVLDKVHGSCRVVKKSQNKVYTLDFTDFRGKGLEDDLLHRDFTINTLALGLSEAIKPVVDEDSLIDFYGARKDIKSKCIRLAHKGAFDEDPLRILRAFSLSAIFGFRIEKDTMKSIKTKKEKLPQASNERIRDELFKILGQANAYQSLIIMDKLRVLRQFLPEIEVMRGVSQGPYHHLNVLNHSFESVKQLEEAVGKLRADKELQSYLKEIISADRSRLALVKLATLLHDIGKPRAKRRRKGRTLFHGHEGIGAYITVGIARRLMLSNDEVSALKKMVFWHLRPGYLADNLDVTPRAIFRYFRDTAKEGVSTLLLSIADQRATKGRLTSEESRMQHEKVVFGLIKRYFKKLKEKELPRLVNGNDVIRNFKLNPSPLVGEILRHIEEMQAIGEIKNKQEALLEIKKWLKSRK
ncbi:MAG: HD domain-containing protein [Candidatus Omnitrophica bacterium]|nr:HD domain-containing protein [Candidatus Omnitrophota bacterium]